MRSSVLYIVGGLLLATLTSNIVYETFRYKEVQYHDRLQQIAKKVNSSNSTWKAGVNSKWINSDIEGVKAHLGAWDNSESGIVLEVVDTVINDLPAEFDARKQWGSKCSSLKEVRDQSNCGSCWAFGAVESITDRHCIKKGEDIRFSAQQMVSCCDSCGFGCNGGYPMAAMDYYVKNGLVTGDLYGTKNWCQSYSLAPCAHHTTSQKYPPCTGELPTPKCAKSCDKDSTYKTPFAKDLHKGSKAYSIANNEQAIMSDIYQNGPIEIAFTVYEDLLTYKSGVYKHVTGDELGGHAVKMVGWGVEDGTPYWIIVNSWNETWGDNGQFKILRGKNECGVEEQCVAALP